ncbi:sensor histidine kinase [Fibrella aquatilis]|uniref:histidine kinase n=1 Tax=Fibrella aquatilis TaxID=2817059 RepID=A0A939G9S1_9BACT|nr:7TM diverse intracellular signaling domain-containing protein [Fibrella aquatilis]MBO0933838.1 hypothetical protein [Fibrella aquatilis]
MTPNRLTHLLLLFWALFGCLQATYAQVTLIESVDHYPIGQQVAVLEDAAQRLQTLQDILPDSMQRRFVVSQQRIINRGFTTAAYWVRFDLNNRSASKQPWLLDVAFGNYATVDLYVCSKRTGQVMHKRGGDWLGRPGREIDAPTYVFHLPVSPGESYTVYLRLVSTHGQVIIPLNIWQQDAFMRSTQLSGLFWGLYYGFMVAVFLYHLTLLLFTPRRHYLLLTTYIGAYLLYELNRGYFLGVRYLWPGNIWLINYALSTTFAVATASFLLLYNAVLNLRLVAPRQQQLLYGLLGLTAFSWLVSVVRPPGVSPNLVITAMGTLCGTFVIFLGGYSWYQGNQPARYYFLAALALFLGVLIHSFNRAGALVSPSFFVQYALNIGSVFEFVFLTFGMADTIREERRQQKRFEQEQAAAIEAAEWRGLATERERVASEMHDGIGSSLLTLRQLIRGAQASPDHANSLSQIEQLVQNAYDEVRKVVNNLMPTEFAKKGLQATLQELIDTLNLAHQTEFYLLLPPHELPLKVGDQYQLLLIIVELVNNIIKHAHATEASIRFITTTECLLVLVRDNGRGLTQVPTQSAGRGWANIRQRLRDLNAAVEVEPQAEQGTRITVRVPVSSAGRI